MFHRRYLLANGDWVDRYHSLPSSLVQFRLNRGARLFLSLGIDLFCWMRRVGRRLSPSVGEGDKGIGVERRWWRGCWCWRRAIGGSHERYLDVYMKPYTGYHFTGDGAAIDKDGYIWIKGRVDDVINVSGHRISTAEIESALIMHKGVAETAVIGVHDELTGHAVVGFVTMKPEFKYDPLHEEALVKELIIQVRKTIGPSAAPKKVYIVPEAPKTRSGKVRRFFLPLVDVLTHVFLPLSLLHPPPHVDHALNMRRIMRKIVAGEGDQLGDLSTAAEPGVVGVIKKKIAEGN
ncbi:acetyl-coenzyme A synthetase 2 [Marasmius sp. AFHP31]|nr:acetyl-coenzyme A synthetase 2 [Marasmius sp. AFHP31]